MIHMWKRLLVAGLAIAAMAVSAVPVQATFPVAPGERVE